MYPNKQNNLFAENILTFFELINRKLQLSKSKIFHNEYRNKNLENAFFPEFIHGCFMLFKTEDFKTLNGFDERYFLYMEDADICRKIDSLGKKNYIIQSKNYASTSKRFLKKHKIIFLPPFICN